ncbi:MAG: Uma2 family endonuclease [Planctomycetota bacterium]
MNETAVAPVSVAPRKRARPDASRAEWDVCQAQSLLLSNVTWRMYSTLVKLFDGTNVCFNYDQGELEIVTKSNEHEGGKKLLARLVEQLALEWDVPIAGFGEATLKRKKLKRGLESDECYYVKNEPLFGHGKLPDPERDPPPDLMIEIEVSRRLLDRKRILAALGVPELWCFDGRELRFLVLNKSGQYEEHEESLNFPGLKSADLEQFLLMQGQKGQHEIVLEFRYWARTRR